MKMVKRHCNTDSRLYFFSNRVVSRWNTLSQDIVSAPSVNSFKIHLNILRQKKMGFFMDSCRLPTLMDRCLDPMLYNWSSHTR